MSEQGPEDEQTHDQDAEPGSAPSGAATEQTEATTGEEEDPDAGPASQPTDH